MLDLIYILRETGHGPVGGHCGWCWLPAAGDGFPGGGYWKMVGFDQPLIISMHKIDKNNAGMLQRLEIRSQPAGTLNLCLCVHELAGQIFVKGMMTSKFVNVYEILVYYY